MSNIWGALDVGKRALLAQQRAIEVTGHNIANVNTPGYSRQRVLLETSDPVSMGTQLVGTGVKDAGIQRLYDPFLRAQISSENQRMERWGAQKSGLERVEMVLDESTGYGLSQAMSEFWNAWQDLANNPAGSVERAALLAKSEIMTNMFNKINDDLAQIQNDIDIGIEGTIDEINPMAERIADLNQKIAEAERSGKEASDFRDKRDLLVKDLSSMIDIVHFENDDGMITVLISGGRPLVQQVAYWQLTTQLNASGLKDVLWDDNSGSTVDISSEIDAGKMKGLLYVRDTSIPDYLTRLNALASEIITEVNALHSTGYGLDESTGNDFFTGTSAASIAVNSNILSDSNLIAASGTQVGVPGDNDNAIDIAELEYALKMTGDTTTFADYYNSLVSDVGSDVLSAATTFDHQKAMVTQLETYYMESISGVSLDEEYVNLVKFQHAYNGAAKLISVLNEILDTLLRL
jgi:flagellar hook-associated protein 1 FlgK